MFRIMGVVFVSFLRLFRRRRSLLLENLVLLQQQLAVLKRRRPRPRLSAFDKLFWISCADILVRLETGPDRGEPRNRGPVAPSRYASPKLQPTLKINNLVAVISCVFCYNLRLCFVSLDSASGPWFASFARTTLSFSRIWRSANRSRYSSGGIRAQESVPSTGSSGCSFADAGRDGNKHSLSSSLKPLSDGTAPDFIGSGG